MGDENPLIYLLGGGSLSLLLTAFIKGAWDWLKGRHERERAQAKDRRDTIATLKQEVRDAEAEADEVRAESIRHQRRTALYWEYAYRLRQHTIVTYQADPDSLPPWPEGH
ncbi:hypothetical protein ACFP47_09180 [Nesterenkonia lacusekhoensis]|uniref:Uncharacterized protein n=1 Tax=Nesterenkonia lacusekhoensis TaxID=150832 RepID=A0ABS4T2B0_9MICC|nr:hypothetical protein [Nesterenkonia lacusekhoensis]MBP2317411.1 hypothetical protein [Nesterenkonia lacusekhoensis]